MRNLLGVLLLLGLLSLPAAGQGVTGTILGTVLDDSGASIPGAAVAVTNTRTGETRQVVTDAAGNYIVTALNVGLYRVEIKREGFKSFVTEGLTLEVNQNIRRWGTAGTSGRSILVGPGGQTMFGAFNHPNFNNPNTAWNSPNFGRILGAGGARVVQFGLKYLF